MNYRRKINIELHKQLNRRISSKRFFEIKCGSRHLLSMTVWHWNNTQCFLRVFVEGNDPSQSLPINVSKTLALTVVIKDNIFKVEYEGTTVFEGAFRIGLIEALNPEIITRQTRRANAVLVDVVKLEDGPKNINPYNLYKLNTNPSSFIGPNELPVKFDLYEAQFWGNADIKKFQMNCLQKSFEFAKQHSPFYSIYDKFSDIPSLSKKEISDNITLFLTDIYSKYSVGKKITSGSTGQPFTFYTDLYDGSILNGKVWRSFLMDDCGVGLRSTEKVIEFSLLESQIRYFRVQDYPDNYHGWKNSSKQEGNWMALPVMSYMTNINQLFDLAIELIQEDKNIGTIIASPSIAYSFIQYCNEKNIWHGDFKLITNGEMVFPEQRDFFNQSCVVYRDYFHAPDASTIFYQCSEGVYHHLFYKSHIELTDFKGLNYLTTSSFFNTSMPLLKFNNGDVIKNIKSLDNRCKCGREGIVAEGIQGRISNELIDKNRNFISPIILFAILSAEIGLGCWRLVQKKQHLVVLYVSVLDQAALNRVKGKLEQFFRPDAIKIEDIDNYDGLAKKQQYIERKNFNVMM